ncbi:hypothetical protein [Sulfuriflexus mobilis]|uniref:hypothetical protein n=1 Tax=Sulfuriflexus mobilis TaxID=1811807 RepID=UPI000F83D114|nr:hypothetical protein [Sulfuriflexus mobilis]
MEKTKQEQIANMQAAFRIMLYSLPEDASVKVFREVESNTVVIEYRDGDGLQTYKPADSK